MKRTTDDIFIERYLNTFQRFNLVRYIGVTFHLSSMFQKKKILKLSILMKILFLVVFIFPVS